MSENRIDFCPELESLYHVHRDRNCIDSGPHGHPYFELILFERGQGSHIINGSSYPIRPGEMVLLSPTDIHSWTNEAGTTHDCIKVAFNHNVYYSLLNCHFDRFPAAAALSEKDCQKARLLLELLYDEAAGPILPHSSELSLDLLESLLFLLRRNLPEQETATKTDPGKVRRILLYIQEHFCEPITAEDAARALSYSPRYFCHLFSKQFGVTFHEYLKSLRLNYAYHLIRYTNQPIIDISCNSGFRSPSYFSTAFKEKYGLSPQKLRNLKEEP